MTDQCKDHCSSEAAPTKTKQAAINPDSLSHVSEYTVPKMDCMSEEGMIRMALEKLEPAVLPEFDIPQRKVRVFHSGITETLTASMQSVGLGAVLDSTVAASPDEVATLQVQTEDNQGRETSILKWLLGINGVMFVVEFIVGWRAQSTGLLADSLDMFADAAVYGIALYAVGRSSNIKLRAAHLSGWLQLALVVGALSEVVRRFLFGSEPMSTLMMGMGFVALVANVWCLLLVSKNRHGGAHMKASWIFSANDVIANTGVILAGALVAWTGSRYPDLIIGSIIALIVLSGAIRILRIKA